LGKSSKDQIWRITDKMPAWMRQFLAVSGFNKEFTLRELTEDQMFELEMAERLGALEREGSIRVIFDHTKHREPLIEATEEGMKRWGPKKK
jgi:hypothetical protein